MWRATHNTVTELKTYCQALEEIRDNEGQDAQRNAQDGRGRFSSPKVSTDTQ